jgi:hypothetical protein
MEFSSLSRFEAVEIPVANSSTLTKFFFPDLPNLRNAKIRMIDAYTPGTISATPLTGSTPATVADMKKTTITLYVGDLQLVYNMPLLTFNNFVNSAADPYVNIPINVNGLTISWTKSFVSVPTALATTNVAYSFGIFYDFGENTM